MRVAQPCHALLALDIPPATWYFGGMMKHDAMTLAIAAYRAAGGTVTIGRTRKAINSKTFGRKGATHYAGRKEVTLCNALGWART